MGLRIVFRLAYLSLAVMVAMVAAFLAAFLTTSPREELEYLGVTDIVVIRDGGSMIFYGQWGECRVELTRGLTGWREDEDVESALREQCLTNI